jgi:hypothetical protein
MMDIHNVFGLLERNGTCLSEDDKGYLEEAWIKWNRDGSDDITASLKYSFKGSSRSRDDEDIAQIRFKRIVYENETPMRAETLVFNFCKQTIKEYKLLNVTKKNYILNPHRRNNL